MNYLVDTDVLSELRKRDKGRTHPGVVAWIESVPDESLHVSVLTLGEIRRGVERLRRRDPVQAEVLGRWLGTVQRDYRDRIVPVTGEVAEEWGRLYASEPLPVVDGLLAATARVHRWTLVTRNTADVTRTGVLLLNPFEGTRG